MLDKETYKREYIRMMDSVRTDHKGEENCNGVDCDECHVTKICALNSLAFCAFETIEAVEKWAKEHPEDEEDRKGKWIKRWDEVYSKSTDLNFVVTRIASEGKARIYEGFNASGGCYERLPDDVEKTGKSFPELAAVIERMNEDD